MAGIASCSKSNDSTPAETDYAPINTIFFVDNPFKVASSGSGYYEYGFTFKPLKNGAISQLGCKMPDSATYRIALWDSASKTVLGEKTFISKATALTFQDITPINLKKDTTYVITIYSPNKPWYYITKPNGSMIQYPLKKGNISLLNYYWISSSSGAAPKFPTIKELGYAAGLPDMVFTTN